MARWNRHDLIRSNPRSFFKIRSGGEVYPQTIVIDYQEIKSIIIGSLNCCVMSSDIGGGIPIPPPDRIFKKDPGFERFSPRTKTSEILIS